MLVGTSRSEMVSECCPSKIAPKAASALPADAGRSVLFVAGLFVLGVVATDQADIYQLLALVAVGVVALFAVDRQKVSKSPPSSSNSFKVVVDTAPKQQHVAATGERQKQHANHHKQAAPNKPDIRQESKVPVMAPSFQARCLDAQVDELVEHITPTLESENAAQRLAQTALNCIQEAFPGVEVIGFANGDCFRGTAFGVAVPEIGLVVKADSVMLLDKLQGRLSKGGLAIARQDPRKLNKAAIRVCTEHLVSNGGFKFRRSAFRGDEPKVTLMAPPALGISEIGIPIDFSVNSMSPLYNLALLRECQQIDPRAKALILMVRRWAKDRGICHAAKGHLAPYAWTVLVVYFLQVGIRGCPLIPPLQGVKTSQGFEVRSGAAKDTEDQASVKWRTGELFKLFAVFYGREINWRSEAVSVRTGRRAPASLSLKLHIMVHEDQSTAVGPNIEDPFGQHRNLGTTMTPLGMQRFREELMRAHTLLEAEDASLSDLLEPWAPPVAADAVRAGVASEDDA